MPKSIPEAYYDILAKRAFAHFVTLMPDGSPQSSPVWIDREGENLVVNSAVGRLKDKNVKRDPRVAISVADPDNPYRCLMIRGEVVEITEEGADDHIDAMAMKYMGKEKYPFRSDTEVRVKYIVKPKVVAAMG